MRVLRFLAFLSALCVAVSCDFMRTVAGRPTTAQLQRMLTEKQESEERARQEAELRAEQERLRAYQADSLAAVQTLSEIDFLKLTELNVRIVSELPARYNVVLGAFSSADNAQNLVSAVKAAGYNASPYQYRNGKTGVVACSSDSFVELGKSFAKLREEKFCPADAWVLVNE
ncbi:MAG: SPOR domain-containing protein [Bacteroidales bacterium]|nr:SPOR domain-containing protein [Bacteroidales bacterium]